MYGDTQVIRRRVGELREQGTDLRALADRLASQADAIAWSGRAAAAMRARMHDRAAHLRATAQVHASASDALGRHAREVEAATEAIADTERRFQAALADAQSRLARLSHQDDEIRATPSPADQALLAFTPPPPGHLDWLTTEIPGG